MTTLRLSNDNDRHFQGYLSGNIDTDPPFTAGTSAGGRLNYYLGEWTGDDTILVHVYVGLSPGERLMVDLADSVPMDIPVLPPISETSLAFLGGLVVAIGGVPMKLVGDIESSGDIAYNAHYRARVGSMIHVDLWLTWYPDAPAWCTGEIAICASNPEVPDVVAHIPADLRLVVGDAIVGVPGLQPNAPLMAAGDWLADGQSRVLPITLLWPRHCSGQTDYDSAYATNNQLVHIRGIERLHHIGNPRLPVGFDGRTWTASMMPEVMRALTTWKRSPLDPSMVSGAAGAQGAQAFVCGPAMADPSAVGPIYLGALDGSWPMFHLESSGEQLDWRGHQGLRMFYGRVNRHISTDTLGKSRDPDLYETHGYAGPEDEHWFDWVALGDARLKGTPATQWILRAHAIQFLFRYVVEEPGNWLTANRGVGWMSFLAAELYRNLADRELAEAVASRWRAIYDLRIFPMGADGSWWSWRRDDRIGPGIRAIPWQAEVLAVGLDWAGEVLGHASARIFARNIAAEIVAVTWFHNGQRWTSRDVITQDGSDPGPHVGNYDQFGMKCCDVIVRHDPASEPARSIVAQRIAEATTYQAASWIAPMVVPQ